ncbi:hypothetical protein A0H81_14391 [Grifola frondosa]|uniref:Uncharacterized protein n=1 Tax=Grifola frondosa TaxID=5627 RepID=A0A1C7LLE9_GRIFR|nr:hypothetical protein A0H81_14391 [Grifola frondosa]
MLLSAIDYCETFMRTSRGIQLEASRLLLLDRYGYSDLNVQNDFHLEFTRTSINLGARSEERHIVWRFIFPFYVTPTELYNILEQGCRHCNFVCVGDHTSRNIILATIEVPSQEPSNECRR